MDVSNLFNSNLDQIKISAIRRFDQEVSKIPGNWWEQSDHHPSDRKEDKTLYARFTPSEYTIAYELDGGTNSTANPDSYIYGVGVPSFERCDQRRLHLPRLV